MLSFLAMSEQCKFLNGIDFKCHLTKSLLRVRDQVGLSNASAVELKQLVCESDSPDRNKDCPVFAELQSLGGRSQYAKPVNSQRPLR